MVPQHEDVIDVVLVRAIMASVSPPAMSASRGIGFRPVNVGISSQRDGDSVVRFGFVRHNHDISGHLSRGYVDRLTRRVV